ncbi:TLN1 protein, partial [Pachyramphus minor]|nr:TLN1 protein [Pachyramphus minor]
NQLTNDYRQLVLEEKSAALTTENEEIGSHIKHWMQELGHGCAALVTKAEALQCSPNDAVRIEYPFFPKDFVSHVLAALQAGHGETQACITATSIIADLNTTIIVAVETDTTHSSSKSRTFITLQ